MTSASQGVEFDFYGTGHPIKLAWPALASQNGWLVLDRNGDGLISTGAELFGTLSPQPGTAPKRNGFLALAVYDQPANGGNGDGQIDERDAVYSELMLWVDMNHDGISQPKELITLKQAGIKSISLKFELSKWVDAYGNAFRYRSSIVWANGDHRWVYDVFPVQAHAGR
jgi:hypothetical protein